MTRLNKPWYSGLTQEYWQNTSYLQLGGMNNWFYAVMTMFAQRFNSWSPKFGGRRRLSPSRGYAPGNTDWQLCGSDLFVAIAYK